MMAPHQLRSDHVLVRIQRGAYVVAGVGGLLCVIGAFASPTQFFRSYLVAYLFWVGIALGSMAILMLQHITGGAWGAVIRRILESATRTLPLMAILFVPLAFGMHEIYTWTHADHVAHDPILQHKSLYLNIPFFLARTAGYFIAWMLVALFLNRWSNEQDRTGDVGRRLENLSRGGLVLYGLTGTFAAIDWAMSLEPHWFSTIYGILFVGGQVLTAMAFAIPVAALLATQTPLEEIISPERFHDLGKLLLAFIMLWAYFSLSQFLIIWAGNLPEEIPWYLNRLRGGWQWLAIALIAFHFVLPFVVLLSRNLKRRATQLAMLASALIVVRFVDLYWLVTPAFSPATLHVHWLDVAAPLAIGGLWMAVFVWQLQGRPLIPLHDPSLEEAA